MAGTKVVVVQHSYFDAAGVLAQATESLIGTKRFGASAGAFMSVRARVRLYLQKPSRTHAHKYTPAHSRARTHTHIHTLFSFIGYQYRQVFYCRSCGFHMDARFLRCAGFKTVN